MKFLALFVLALILVQVVFADDWKCEDGVPYIENDCNNCFCDKSGRLGCTEKACLGAPYSELSNCKVGTSYEKDCNKCVCVERLGTICTNLKCRDE